MDLLCCRRHHFAECHENQRVTVWKMIINLLKSPIPQWREKWKSDQDSVSGTGYHQKLITSSWSLAAVYQFGRRPLPRSWVNPAHRQNDRTNDHITPPALAESQPCLLLINGRVHRRNVTVPAPADCAVMRTTMSLKGWETKEWRFNIRPTDGGW